MAEFKRVTEVYGGDTVYLWGVKRKSSRYKGICKYLDSLGLSRKAKKQDAEIVLVDREYFLREMRPFNKYAADTKVRIHGNKIAKRIFLELLEAGAKFMFLDEVYIQQFSYGKDSISDSEIESFKKLVDIGQQEFFIRKLMGYTFDVQFKVLTKLCFNNNIKNQFEKMTEFPGDCLYDFLHKIIKGLLWQSKFSTKNIISKDYFLLKAGKNYKGNYYDFSTLSQYCDVEIKLNKAQQYIKVYHAEGCRLIKDFILSAWKDIGIIV